MPAADSSSENVFDLEARRAAREAERSAGMSRHPAGSGVGKGQNALACECGSEWFELLGWDEAGVENGGICFDASGHVRAIAGLPHCMECGEPINGGPWADYM